MQQEDQHGVCLVCGKSTEHPDLNKYNTSPERVRLHSRARIRFSDNRSATRITRVVVWSSDQRGVSRQTWCPAHRQHVSPRAPMEGFPLGAHCPRLSSPLVAQSCTQTHKFLLQLERDQIWSSFYIVFPRQRQTWKWYISGFYHQHIWFSNELKANLYKAIRAAYFTLAPVPNSLQSFKN